MSELWVERHRPRTVGDIRGQSSVVQRLASYANLADFPHLLFAGPPGTGKTMLARACAAQTNATFLKLAGPQLVQMYIGDGAKIVRDAFALAAEKAPTIIFIGKMFAILT